MCYLIACDDACFSKHDELASLRKEIALLRDLNEKLEVAASSGERQQQLMREDFRQAEVMWRDQEREYQQVCNKITFTHMT